MLNLSDSTLRESNKHTISTKISSDGTQAYLVYQISISEDESILAAELFDVSSDKLKTVSIYVPEDLSYPIIRGGSASEDFSIFTIIESTNDQNNGKIRVRTLKRGIDENSHKLLVIAETYINCIIKGFCPRGGIFVDNKYILVHSVVEDSTNQKSKIWLLNINDLSLYSSLVVNGIITSDVIMIKPKGVIGISFCMSQGIYDMNSLHINWKPDYKLMLYKIDENKKTFVKCTEKKLSYGGISITSTFYNKWYITIGTHLLTNSQLCIYSIDKNWELYLEKSSKINSSIENIKISNNCKYYLLSHRIHPYTDFSSSVIQVGTDIFNLDIINPIIPTNIYTSFDCDENFKKIIITCSNDNNYSNKNIFLYTFNK